MLDLYTWHTPNGKKAPILLAELDWSYELHLVNIGQSEQKRKEYLATKAGRFLPTDEPGRAEVLSWVYWQVGGPGPFFGQMIAFGRQEPRNEAAFEKFFDESKRLVGVFDGRLGDREWIAGRYSIADMINYPWFAAAAEFQPGVLDGADGVRRWMSAMASRPAVQKGMALAVA